MAVEAALVYNLAQHTGLGVELCKVALERAKNDIDEAIKLLKRWAGAKFASTDSKRFGATCAYFLPEYNTIAAVEVICSDELVAKSREFYELVGKSTSEIVSWGKAPGGEQAIKALEDQHKCKIDIKFARFERQNPYCLLTTYTHGDKIAVALETEIKFKEGDEAKAALAFGNRQFKLFSFDLAMHIAAFNPVTVHKEHIPQNLKQEMLLQIEKELAKEGKDMKFWEVATTGKMNKWMEQRSLLNQIFIKSEKDTVEEMRKKISEKIGADVNINRFARFAIGL